LRSVSSRRPKRFVSYFGRALALSIALHLVVLPLFGLKAQARAHTEHEGPPSVTTERHPRPTSPPTPKPSPPPPRPTHPPVRYRTRPVAERPRLHVPRTVHVAQFHAPLPDAPPKLFANAPLRGNDTEASPGPIETGSPSSQTPVPASPKPDATPKPSCANPNADAAVKGAAVEPEFPTTMRERGATGTTEIEVALDAAGTPIELEIHRSSGFEILDRAALAAARATSYTPAVVNCVKTAGRYLFTVDFDDR